MSRETEGPYILWINYGCEGWKPGSYHSLEEALRVDTYGSEAIITKEVSYFIQEIVKE